jgi:hypothetical protein
VSGERVVEGQHAALKRTDLKWWTDERTVDEQVVRRRRGHGLRCVRPALCVLGDQVGRGVGRGVDARHLMRLRVALDARGANGEAAALVEDEREPAAIAGDNGTTQRATSNEQRSRHDR